MIHQDNVNFLTEATRVAQVLVPGIWIEHQPAQATIQVSTRTAGDSGRSLDRERELERGQESERKGKK